MVDEPRHQVRVTRLHHSSTNTATVSRVQCVAVHQHRLMLQVGQQPRRKNTPHQLQGGGGRSY